MIVVADTSPLNYLVLIGEIELLPQIFGNVLVPDAVWREMGASGSPKMVKDWLETDPAWVNIERPANLDHTINLGLGEIEAISLANERDADLVLIDDRKARIAAIERGLDVAGTINILELAAKRRLIDLSVAFHDLQQTNFRIAPRLITEILHRNR